MYDRLTLETLVLQDLPVWDFTSCPWQGAASYTTLESFI